jgi:hypothetical protein
MAQDHQNLDPKIRAAVVWQADISTDILKTLAQDPNVVVRQNVLRVAQQKADLELLEFFLVDPDPVIRAELALCPTCPLSLLRRLTQDPNPALRGIVEPRIDSSIPEAPATHDNPEEMPEQDEPTGALNSTDKLPPAPKEETPVPTPIPTPTSSAPKPVLIPTRTPTALPQRSNPLPIRAPIAASTTPSRPSLIPVKAPLITSTPTPHPALLVTPSPAPFTAPPLPRREEISKAPMEVAPIPFAASNPSKGPSMPTLAEEEPIEIAAPKAPSPLPGKGELRIHLTASDKSQSELTFAKDLIIIGRVMGNDIVLAQGNVSKNHCRIFVFNDQLYVEDLKSTNGTQLNKNNITPREPHPLLPTDELGVGSTILKLELFL